MSSEATQLTMLIKMAPKKAAPTPSTLKPKPRAVATTEVSHSIRAFTTNANKPRVSTYRGKVRPWTIGLMKALTRPKIAPAMIAASQPSTLTPGTSTLTTRMVRTLTRSRASSLATS